MSLSTLKVLYRHMEWADALVWRAVLAFDEASRDEKLRGYFYHLHLVQHAFLRAWRAEPTPTSYPTFDDACTLMSWGRSYHREISAHLELVTDEQIARPMQLPWTDIVEKELGRTPEKLSVGETMLQVPLHSLYHRGQVNARLREVGGEPPTVDYIVWMWRGQPAPEWEPRT
jgi:uncharacterized damage-inducible protein DinB